MARVDPLDPSTFPAPHIYATYISWRSTSFKTHATMALVKNAISGTTTRRNYQGGRTTQCDVYVYKWDEENERWVQTYMLPKGTDVDQHPLYQKPVSSKRPIKGPSDKQVDAAIQSILKAGEADG